MFTSGDNVLKYLVAIIFGLLLSCPLLAWQGVSDGYFQAGKVPWNSSYLPTIKDTLVHGEDYRGYPGPLPKLFLALGLDASHPGIDTELLQHVDREVPRWYGSCNGWAVSAIRYEEPLPLVVNGIKFLTGDLKALLTAIHKDNSVTFYGTQDPVNGGLSAESFEEILFERVAGQETSIVFDIDISNEVWNYPVIGFWRESESVGEWTEVKVTVRYPRLIPLRDSVGEPSYYDLDYFYRYKTATRSDYQWMEESLLDHPKRAWLNRKPYYEEMWLLLSNHFYDMSLYRQLEEMAADRVYRHDLFEPNNSLLDAKAIRGELIMGSLLLGDEDFYSFELNASEQLRFHFKVYDGPPLYLVFLDENGTELSIETQTVDDEFVFEAPTKGSYALRIWVDQPNPSDAFYQLVFDEDLSSYSANPNVVDSLDFFELTAINTRNQEGVFSGESLQKLPAYGAHVVAPTSDVRRFRSSQRTVWAETKKSQNSCEKRYYRDHELDLPYLVPHISLKNGWDTKLSLHAETGEPVFLEVFNAAGDRLERVFIPLDDHLSFSGSLKLLLTNSQADCAWLRLNTVPENRLHGTVSFVNGLQTEIKLDIKSSPRIGELLVFDLKAEGQGGTGLAVVNVSRVDNEVLYRLKNKEDEIHAEGRLMLKPGEKWLTTVKGLGGPSLSKEFTLFLHTQYPVDCLVIQHQAQPYRVYGHRLFSEELDQLQETYISVPENWDWSSLMFANYNLARVHVLFEGFSADGTLQGRFNIELGNPLDYREIRFAPLSQIFQNGVDIKDLDAITHLRATSRFPLYGMELFGDPATTNPMAVPLPNVFENP